MTNQILTHDDMMAALDNVIATIDDMMTALDDVREAAYQNDIREDDDIRFQWLIDNLELEMRPSGICRAVFVINHFPEEYPLDLRKIIDTEREGEK